MAKHRLDAKQRERFLKLAWPLLPVVLRTAKFLDPSQDAAEDLAQETMIKAMTAIDSYQDGSDMKAWLMTILRRTHIDRLRARKRRPDQLSLDASPALQAGLEDDHDPSAGRYDDNWADPDELLNRFDDHTIVHALQSLPDPIRWTLLLVDVEQLEHTDVAAVLDVPVGTIKSRAFRGRQMLRDRLYETAEQRGWVKSSPPDKEHSR